MSSQGQPAVLVGIRVRRVTCGECRGSGWIIRDIEKPADVCPRCGGKGQNEKTS